ncbi:MAG: hypothetical protein JWP32_2117 [Schumannella sp.]|jgi:hypothetical protein|nr:hypothetical protein [Schumannella sp.]
MQPFDDVAALSRLLPGRWTVKATNFPMWLSGERRDPVFEYGVVRQQPLTLSDRVAYVDASGRQKTITGTDRWTGQGFTWKMRGIAGLFVKSRWEVAGARQGLAVIRFEKSIATPSGVDVVVGEGVDATDLRSVIAADPASFGLTLEEFASLTWLDHLPPLA